MLIENVKTEHIITRTFAKNDLNIGQNGKNNLDKLVMVIYFKFGIPLKMTIT